MSALNVAASIYFRRFPDEAHAADWMRTKNRASRNGVSYVLVDGPEDDFVVMDLRSAIAADFPYRWEA